MSHELMFRDGTWDRGIWEAVAVHNEYRLDGRFDPQDVVIDVGAHIGSFTYAALDRGAGRVVAVEADPENAFVLRHNIHMACGATDRCVIVTAAAWRSDSPEPLPVVRFERAGENTGGGGVGEEGFPVATVAFDRLVELAAGDGPVRLFKLDCEGSEWPILFTSKRLGQVREIVGEYHERETEWGRCGAEKLREFLHAHGFTVEVQETRPGLGLFWAKREGVSGILRNPSA
jgi:FkbM family methyltransferase